MQTTIRPTLAFIDDDERILRAMQLLFRNDYDVFVTTEPEAYLDYIRFNLVHVAVSDQRMPIRQGVDILREIKDISPFTIRILLTGYADLEAIIGSINEGEIFRYLTKPCKAEEIKTIIDQAVKIAQANFAQQRGVSILPTPLDNDDLDMMVGMVNGLTASTLPIATLQDETDSALVTASAQPKFEKLLLVDDSLDTKHKIEQQFLGKYEILYAQTLEQAYDHLAHNNVGVCITDVMINNESIAPIIYTLKENNPSLVVLVQTEFQDASALIDLINKGQIFRCLPKPIRSAMLEVSVARAFDYHTKLRGNNLLADRHTVEPSQAEEIPTASPKLKRLVGLFRQKFS